MTYDSRLVVVALASFAVANVPCCALVLQLWQRRSASSSLRAEQLRHLRLLPALVATLSMGMAALSFAFFEPRGQEPIGSVLVGLAVLAAVLFAGTIARAARAMLRAPRVERAWMTTAEAIALDGWSGPAFAIDAEFPIVAIVGIRRPRLVIARRVLAHCTPEELRAILAHERAHADRRDNLGRLLLNVTPDVISWLPVSRQIEAAWHDATEESADENAVSLGAQGRLLLAEALIRVARLAPAGTSPAVVPVSALYRGENIERRVRRLLRPLAPVTMRWSRTQRRLGRIAFVIACVLALQGVYEIVEAAVRFLP